MPTLLLDTDVVSFQLKGDSRATAYAPLLQGNRLALSFMTVAELFQWVAVRKWGPRRIAQLDQVLASYLIVPVDVEMCRIWGTLRAEQQSAGRSIAPQDAWIAATALRHSLALVTHNASDFQNIVGLDVRTAAHP
ncbi:MAG: type II toxin-antitoxin system VapC family toxin [Ktedonobacterales bacterium]